MKITRRQFLHLAAGAAALSALSHIASAQAYPSRPIMLAVPFSAGGGSDITARVVAEKMSKTLGQQIVVENRPGAGGTVAMRQVAKSLPDGYTLVLGNPGTLAIAPTAHSNLGYDPRQDFSPVGFIGWTQFGLFVHPSVPGAIGSGTDRTRSQGARQTEFRLGWHGFRHAPDRRVVRKYGGDQTRPYPLQRCRTRNQRSAGRSFDHGRHGTATDSRPCPGWSHTRIGGHRLDPLRHFPGCTDGRRVRTTGI